MGTYARLLVQSQPQGKDGDGGGSDENGDHYMIKAVSQGWQGSWTTWEGIRQEHQLVGRVEDPTGKTKLPHLLDLRHASLSSESQPVVRE